MSIIPQIGVYGMGDWLREHRSHRKRYYETAAIRKDPPHEAAGIARSVYCKDCNELYVFSTVGVEGVA